MVHGVTQPAADVVVVVVVGSKDGAYDGLDVGTVLGSFVKVSGGFGAKPEIVKGGNVEQYGHSTTLTVVVDTSNVPSDNPDTDVYCHH